MVGLIIRYKKKKKVLNFTQGGRMKDVTGRGKCCTYSFVYLLCFPCKDASVPWSFGTWRGHRVWIESIES